MGLEEDINALGSGGYGPRLPRVLRQIVEDRGHGSVTDTRFAKLVSDEKSLGHAALRELIASLMPEPEVHELAEVEVMPLDSERVLAHQLDAAELPLAFDKAFSDEFTYHRILARISHHPGDVKLAFRVDREDVADGHLYNLTHSDGMATKVASNWLPSFGQVLPLVESGTATSHLIDILVTTLGEETMLDIRATGYRSHGFPIQVTGGGYIGVVPAGFSLVGTAAAVHGDVQVFGFGRKGE